MAGDGRLGLDVQRLDLLDECFLLLTLETHRKVTQPGGGWVGRVTVNMNSLTYTSSASFLWCSLSFILIFFSI